MPTLAPFAHLLIDWNMTPEHAVTNYLEWGANDWHAEYPPVRSKNDVSIYFVVDNWDQKPVIRLVRRNTEKAEDLVTLPYPEELLADFYEHNGKSRGLYTPTEALKHWLKKKMGQE